MKRRQRQNGPDWARMTDMLRKALQAISVRWYGLFGRLKNEYGRRRAPHVIRHRKARRARLLAMAAGLVLLVFGSAKLIGYFSDLAASKRTSEELRQVYQDTLDEQGPETAAPDTSPTAAPAPAATEPPVPAETPVTDTAAPEPAETPVPRLGSPHYPGNPNLHISDRFKALRRSSKYIIGWLKLQNLLDEPVAQRDNDYFLDHDAKGYKNANGSIFLDAGIAIDRRPWTYMLYGHNMKTGAMFGCLRNYENSAYYHADPFITFDMLYETGRYAIFAVSNINIDDPAAGNFVDFYELRSDSVEDRKRAIDALVESSVHSCRIDVQPDDQLLILVTCVDDDSERRVVAARRVREGESEEKLLKLIRTSWTR